MSPQGRLLFGVSVVLFLSYSGLYFALQTWMPFMAFILGPAVLALCGWIFYDRQLIYQFLTLKTTKHGLNMGALSLIVIVFLIGLNLLAVKKNKIIDTSELGLYTLSPLSLQLLEQLDSELHVKFFYKQGAENVETTRKVFTQLVELYEQASPLVKVQYVEMNANPKMTADFGANRPAGEVFLDYKGQKNRVESQFLGAQGQKFREQDFTNAMIKVSRKTKKVIYFVEGDEQRESDNQQNPRGTSSFKQLLEKNSYEVKKINLIRNPQIPEDAQVLILLGPQSQLQKFQVDLIVQFLEKGGSLFLTFDDKNSAGLNDFLASLGLKLDSHYVFNIVNSPLGQVVSSNEPTVAVDYSSQSDITRIFSANQKSIFIAPNSLSLLNKNNSLSSDQIVIDFIVKSPEASVALERLDSENYQGQPRAFNLVAQVSGKLNKSDKPFKSVIFADTDFLSNGAIYQNVNRDLALNAVALLAGDTDLVSIAPKEIKVTQMLVAPPEFSQYYKFIVIGLFFPLPLLFLAIAFGLWLKRRHA